MKHKKLFLGINILLLASCFILLASLASCGRRGDPVLIEPREEKAVESSKDEEQKNLKERESSADSEKSGQEPVRITVPDQPGGLTGIYTGTGIVITWDEVSGENIKYRVYRSSGEEYTLAGETVTPAFTDKMVEPGMKYYYKVSAVAADEGTPSEEIQIMTEVH